MDAPSSPPDTAPFVSVTSHGALHKAVVPDHLIEASKELARLYWGNEGAFAYQAYEHINRTLFGGRLPWTLIQWAPTAWGGCLGHTRVWGEPVISLHPSVMGGGIVVNANGAQRGPWGISPDLLGPVHAYDVLVHEAIHVWIEHVLGGWTGESSHNCDEWVAEANRLMPLVGITGGTAGRNKPMRVEVPGEFTKTGRPRTRVQRVDLGSLPLDAVSRFPSGVREYLGQLDHYRRRVLPFTPDLAAEALRKWRVTPYNALHIEGDS